MPSPSLEDREIFAKFLKAVERGGDTPNAQAFAALLVEAEHWAEAALAPSSSRPDATRRTLVTALRAFAEAHRIDLSASTPPLTGRLVFGSRGDVAATLAFHRRIRNAQPMIERAVQEFVPWRDVVAYCAELIAKGGSAKRRWPLSTWNELNNTLRGVDKALAHKNGTALRAAARRGRDVVARRERASLRRVFARSMNMADRLSFGALPSCAPHEIVPRFLRIARMLER